MDRRAFVVKTNFCWAGLGYAEGGLCRVELSLEGAEDVQRKLVARLGSGVNFERPPGGSRLAELPDKMISYFGGERVDFDEPVDLDRLTPFQRRVLEVTRGIPYGEVRSYAWVAERVGNPRSFRAVGQALGINPVAIVIPCHRVITSQGTLGGFGWGGDVKRALLAMEGSEGKLRTKPWRQTPQ